MRNIVLCKTKNRLKRTFMILYFKQRFFSWFDSYDIYDENGETAYTVQGRLSWGHKLEIYDRSGNLCGTVKEKIFTFLPKFALYANGAFLGYIQKKFAFFKAIYEFDYNMWSVDGGFMEWDYTITDAQGNLVATVGKELFHLTDQYVLDIVNHADALNVLMFTLAIDAEKCSRS